jgi:hypothetical protein
MSRSSKRGHSIIVAAWRDKLETIGLGAFNHCRSFRNITMPSVWTIARWAFNSCKKLKYLVLPKDLETIREFAFCDCTSLRRIAMTLKDNIMIEDDVFNNCQKLTTVDLVGRYHKTISSLHLESWKNEMREEINRINQSSPLDLMERQ